MTPVVAEGHPGAEGRAWPRAQGVRTSCHGLGSRPEVLFLEGHPPPRGAGAHGGLGLQGRAVLKAVGLRGRLPAALAPRPGRREGSAGDRLRGPGGRLCVAGRASERVCPAGGEVRAGEGRGKRVRGAPRVLLGPAPRGERRQCRPAAPGTQNAGATLGGRRQGARPRGARGENGGGVQGRRGLRQGKQTKGQVFKRVAPRGRVQSDGGDAVGSRLERNSAQSATPRRTRFPPTLPELAPVPAAPDPGR